MALFGGIAGLTKGFYCKGRGETQRCAEGSILAIRRSWFPLFCKPRNDGDSVSCHRGKPQVLRLRGFCAALRMTNLCYEALTGFVEKRDGEVAFADHFG